MIEKTAKVWLGGRKGVTAPIHLSQYDTGWRFLFSVYDGDAVYTASDATTVYLEGKKADGTVFAVPGTFSDGVAVVECTASITAAVGVIDCELRISEDGETVGTANFDMLVEAAPLQGYVASGDDFSAMQQVLDGSEEAAADALSSKNAAAASAAAAALSAATAQVQAGMAYQIAATAAAMTDHTIGYVYVGSETGYVNGGWYYWDGTAWNLGGQATDPTGTVAGAPLDAKAGGDGIRDLKSGISNDIDISAVTWETGYRVGTNGELVEQATDSASDYIAVLSPSKILVTHADLRINRCVCGYTADNSFVGVLAGNDSEIVGITDSDVSFDVPSNVKFIRLTRFTATQIASELKYVDITSAPYDIWLNGRNFNENILTAMSQFICDTEFDLITDMPYESWWYGTFDKINASLEADFEDFPGEHESSDYVKVIKRRTSTAPGGIYEFINAGYHIEIFRSYSGINTYRQFSTIDDIYGQKAVDDNIPMVLTQYRGVEYSDQNPMSPSDIPINTVTFRAGASLAGFNNALFTLTSSAYYWCICVGSRQTGSEQYRQYFMLNRNTNFFWIGASADNGQTVTWYNWSKDDTLSVDGALAGAKATGDAIATIKSEIGDIYFSRTAQSRTFDFAITINPGDIYYIQPLEWSGADYAYYTVSGIDSDDTVTAIHQIDGVNTKRGVLVHFTKPYVKIRIGVRTDSTPATNVTLKGIICKVGDWPTLAMIEHSPLQGKYLSILGASTSTFEGYIPTGYQKYYPYTGSAYDGSGPNCVTVVHDTYWQKTVDALGLHLLVDNASSGSRLTTTGDPSMAMCGDRCTALHTSEHDPDIIVIQTGMNDFNYEVDLGEYDGTQMPFPTDTTKFREALAIMLNKILTRYPRATVVLGTIPNHEDNFTHGAVFPERNDSGVLLKAFNDAIRDIAHLFGIKVVDWYASGISYQNLNLFTQDWSSASGYGMHANKWGHSLMANALIEVLDPSSKIKFNTAYIV